MLIKCVYRVCQSVVYLECVGASERCEEVSLFQGPAALGEEQGPVEHLL